MEIKKLRKEFIGRGEVKGFVFKQIYEHEKFYVYEVNCDPELTNKTYYELIKRMVMHGHEYYPGSATFGMFGWYYPTIEDTINGVKNHFDIDITF